MVTIPIERFNINKFWEKTPTALKYILVFAILIATTYFIFAKRSDDIHAKEIETMKVGVIATYELIDNFEEFRTEQIAYNREVLRYLRHLHILVEELNGSTNRKIETILKNKTQKPEEILEKIELLNEAFEKLSKAYKEDILHTPNLEDNKAKKTYVPNALPNSVPKF